MVVVVVGRYNNKQPVSTLVASPAAAVMTFPTAEEEEDFAEPVVADDGDCRAEANISFDFAGGLDPALTSSGDEGPGRRGPVASATAAASGDAPRRPNPSLEVVDEWDNHQVLHTGVQRDAGRP